MNEELRERLESLFSYLIEFEDCNCSDQEDTFCVLCRTEEALVLVREELTTEEN